MDVNIIPVENNSGVKKFINCQWNFYKDDKNWVPPMKSERKKVLDVKNNPFYQHSEIQLFLAESNSEIVGRIAAIMNYNHNKTHNDKVGFFGFFESIDNQDVATALFDAAASWLRKKGMDAMRGPENPSMNDEIGLLIDGFDSPPVIMMTYNPKYHIDLIENYGFQKAKDLYAYQVVYGEFQSEKLLRMQEFVRKRYDVTIREVNFKNKNQLKKDVDTFKDVYNAAWVPNWGFVKWTEAEMDFIAQDLKTVADPSLAIIAESKGEIAGFALALPDINQCLIHNKSGSMLGAVWHLLTKKKNINNIRIIALGIIPKFQKSGIDSVLYYELGARGNKMGALTGEASWVLEDNEMMNRGLTTTMNGKVYKTYRLYEKKI